MHERGDRHYYFKRLKGQLNDRKKTIVRVFKLQVAWVLRELSGNARI